MSRAATFVAVLMAPLLFAVLYDGTGWPLRYALLATIVGVMAFRGLIDIIVHKLVPQPPLIGDTREDLQQDAMERRRLWFWRGKFRFVLVVVIALAVVTGVIAFFGGGSPIEQLSSINISPSSLGTLAAQLLGILVVYFFINLFILMGPLIYMSIRQARGYEPGDADWGVRLDDVRGQAEPKEEVKRVITLWQSGDDFRAAGGKPERGLLFIGQPGTGKTMLSKAIATSFNCPIVTMPGSGFAGTFIGMDALAVQFLIRKARRLARKWGGQCIIFIDEIDAVGMRRAALGRGSTAGGMTPGVGTSFEEFAFHGPWGTLTSSGDLLLETRAWREKLFASRAPAPAPVYPAWLARTGENVTNFIFPGGMGGMGGSLALNQLLVQMDGVDAPRGPRKFFTNKTNTLLDASYIVPRRIGKVSLRLPPPKPSNEQIYFIGATNVPIEQLDPALIRPGRMGRHIWFRTPTKEDRRDIFDLYLDKVAHVPELDTDRRRDELARITHGYSPAMIEQICSMALTLAHADGRGEADWHDVVEAMTTIESGTAQGVDYVPEETRAVAIHEAGHAAASHVYMQDVLSTRLSIRKRGGSLGHHQAIEKEERFSSWRHEEVGKLVWTLGAMAAEHVFYGENSTGVGGDVNSATTRAAWMVGLCGMGAEPINLNGRRFETEEERQEIEDEYMRRFERIGMQIMNRSAGMRESGDPIASVLGDPSKRRTAAQILGQAYITAVCLVRNNREKVLHIAETLVQKREMHGDEVVELLDSVELQAPYIDINDESIWPQL